MFLAAASRFTGRLAVIYGVQMRTSQKEHSDQHWVNALTWYYLEWMVELRQQYPGVEFFGQDHKANIPVGETLAVSTGVCANNRGIVAAAGEQSLRALDH